MGCEQVSKVESWKRRVTQTLNRVQARRLARAGRARAFVSAPEPLSIGHYARGRQMLAGNFLLNGQVIEAPGTQLWDLAQDGTRFDLELQGFGWLDDLAAVGDARARARAQDWTGAWIARYGAGRGPGWTPAMTGRRVIRWINHAIFLMQGRDAAWQAAFFRSLSGQVLFLSRRWKAATPGLPRFEALSGLIYAGLALEGMEDLTPPAISALAADCIRQVDGDGGIATRSPEELMQVLTQLAWVRDALRSSDKEVPQALTAAIERIAPTLRGLRHADGALARFHGGGRGLEGWLDGALAASGVKSRPARGAVMGFARMHHGRTSLIADAAPPPSGAASGEAHASTLAFELTSGRRPIVVNCGAATSFGLQWRRAGRATPSHSTLGLDGFSSARLAPPDADGVELLTHPPSRVLTEWTDVGDGTRLEMSHDGWRGSHGLTHARTLELPLDGRALVGEDVITTLTDADRTRFDRAMDGHALQGIPYVVRFHLHPDVAPELDMGGTAVSLTLRSGEIWIFRSEGAALKLEKSVYLENGRLRPRTSAQVVLSGRALSYATRVRWSLAKAHETPDAVRDTPPASRSQGETEDIS